jgi:hypothetical protein
METNLGMLDLAFFRPGALKDTPAGALHIPAVKGSEQDRPPK